MKRYAWPVILSLFGYPAIAWAHLVNQDVGEFYAGMLHPLTSAEHLIPALTLGLLAGREGIRPSRWVLAVFPTALMLGIWMGGGTVAPPAFSQAVNLAVIALLGLLLAFSRKLPMGAVIGMAGATGLVLGWRSGIDMAAAGVGVQFIPGVALAGFLLIALVSPWIAQGGSNAMRTALCATGWAVTLAGVYLTAKFVLAGDATAFRSIGLPTQESLTSLVESETLSLPVMAGAFLAAMAWGAAHALTPGHGKAIVGAYLIGSRGTPMHAVYLGLTVTATHTFGIFALGFVALFASRYLLPDQLMPWLAAGSGVIVLAIGASMFVNRIRPLLRMRAGSVRHGHDHRHHHAHDHHDHHHHVHDHGHPHGHHTHAHLPPDTGGGGVSWRALLGLGISGGLLPCPAALVLLLAAIAMERTALGILLVVAFSIGLSGVLTAVGLLFIKGSRLLRGIPLADALSPYAPAFSALLIFAIGLVITVNAVAG